MERIRRLFGPIREARTYLRILYLLLALPLGVIEFSFLVTALSFGFGTAITLIGIPVLVATVWAWRWMAHVERRIIGRLLGTEIPEPYRPDPPDTRWWKRLGARLADPATWKDLAFLLLQLPLGIVSFSIAVSVIGFGLRLLLAPAFTEPFGDGDWIAWLDINSTAGAIAAVPLGALILLLGIPGLNALGRLYGWFAGLLLGSNADPELTAQVHELEDARSRIIAAADAERRRIERDLHDGAQQRLVALALNLRMAEQRVDAGDPGASELVRQAGEEAQLALKELRDLARGIHPAILTNRGLPAALEDLASRATVPVDVVATPGERLPDPVEAAAYFVVSECLANIGKHAEATSATVSVRAVDERLYVEVSDDGRGG
ncbi:MAG TPA: sensor domain-containing protein, partial [Thermoleophilaceae bacterium]